MTKRSSGKRPGSLSGLSKEQLSKTVDLGALGVSPEAEAFRSRSSASQMMSETDLSQPATLPMGSASAASLGGGGGGGGLRGAASGKSLGGRTASFAASTVTFGGDGGAATPAGGAAAAASDGGATMMAGGPSVGPSFGEDGEPMTVLDKLLYDRSNAVHFYVRAIQMEQLLSQDLENDLKYIRDEVKAKASDETFAASKADG